MAAYAALLSLTHTIDQIQNHPRPPISLDKEQVESLTVKLTFLRDFLENHSIDVEVFEGRIADAAYEAEDLIETHTVDQFQVSGEENFSFIRGFRGLFRAKPNSCDEENSVSFEERLFATGAGMSHIVHQFQPANPYSSGKEKFSFRRYFRGLRKPTSRGENVSPADLYEGLEKVMQDLGSIERDLAEFSKDKGIELGRNYSMPAGQPRSPPATHSAMVGLEDVLLEAMDKLTGQQSSRQIIPIVGMGGIGKTTLAKTIYVNPLIVQHFDFHGWATISQEYDSKEILVEILVCLKNTGSRESLRRMDEHELGEKLYKNLSGRRYLIVLDDIWSIEAWDRIKFFFPDYNNGSRIVITTRLSNLAFELSGSCGFEMGFLDEDDSWNLFQKSAFGEEGCPLGLDDIGKRICRNCKGLPLSIIVVGGLLAKSNQTQEHWEYIAENLNSIVNLDDNERCLRTLRLSYNHLPVHLKPCFLYMGIFPEDRLIRVSTLIKLWVAEGFLKPISDKTLEVAGKEYLKDLAQRNLVIVEELGYYGNIKLCRMHDLLSDLCVKEAEKGRFFRVLHGSNTGQRWHAQRRIATHGAVFYTMPSSKLARSLICYDERVSPPQNYSRLLRVFHRLESYFSERGYSLVDIFRPVNLRHLAVLAPVPKGSQFSSLFYHLWNLQTLIVHYDMRDFSSDPPQIDIWRMPRLRHVKLSAFHLPDPHASCDDSDILCNLQTLKGVTRSNWTEDVMRRIPNLKKLNLMLLESSSPDDYCFDNLSRLCQLESLHYNFSSWQRGSTPRLGFPLSLKKLTLENTCLLWEDLADKVGHLPHLRVLKLEDFSCKGPEWVTVEGRFCSLTFLDINLCYDLEYWTMGDWAHLPCLEHLVLTNLPDLKAVPLQIGDIPTLESIELYCCSDSAVISAKEIAEVQEGMGNEGLKVSVVLCRETELVVDSLASSNFQVKIGRT